MTELARLVDGETLDRSPGARGQMRVQAPAAWASEQATVEIVAPERVICARCQGGGCDGCGRSGAFRIDADPARRTFRVRLPRELGAGVILRVVEPFGLDGPLRQLLCEVRAGDEPSGCGRVPGASGAPSGAPGVLLGAMVLVALLLLWLALGR